MSVITIYLNHNAQTPLNRFFVYMLHSQLCNKYSDKSNRWSLSLSVWKQHRPLKVDKLWSVVDLVDHTYNSVP